MREYRFQGGVMTASDLGQLQTWEGRGGVGATGAGEEGQVVEEGWGVIGR